jgi:hypothetical protein
MNLELEKKRKHLILSQTKLNLAKKILGTKSETEKNKKAVKATENFLKSNIEIRDVFGNLEEVI